MNEAKPPYWERLDPDARSVARFIAETLRKPVRELGAEVARKTLATPPPERPLTPLDQVESLIVATRSGGIGARLYHPDGPPPGAGPRPTLVYLHGGGFVLGTLDGVDEVCRAIAARSGWAVFSLEYRLAPENPYPAALDDCFDAFAWLRRSAPGLGLDPDTIAVGVIRRAAVSPPRCASSSAISDSPGPCRRCWSTPPSTTRSPARPGWSSPTHPC